MSPNLEFRHRDLALHWTSQYLLSCHWRASEHPSAIGNFLIVDRMLAGAQILGFLFLLCIGAQI